MEIVNASVKAYAAIIKGNKEYSAGLQARLDGLTWEDKHDDEIGKALAENIQDVEITNMILHNNARVAAFSEYIPVFVEVWNKYAGKKYGEKTKEKINKEIKERCGYSVWVHKSYCHDEISVYYLTPEGFRDFSFQYNELDLSVFSDNPVGGLLQNNVIQPVTIEALPTPYNYKFVENVPQRVQEIKEAFTAAKQAAERANNAVKDFNGLLPAFSAIKEMDSVRVRSWLY